MKILHLFIAVFLISFAAQSQTYSRVATPINYNKILVDSLSLTPADTVGAKTLGRIIFKRSDSTLYIANGTKWNKYASGGITSETDPNFALKKPQITTVSGLQSTVVPQSDVIYKTTDNLGGDWIWKPSSTKAENIGTVIKVPGITTGAFERQFSGSVDVRWFGAVGDGTTDDTHAIQAAIDYASSIGAYVYIPKSSSFYKVIPATTKTGEGGSTAVAFVMRSNMHIIADAGATIKLADNQSTDISPKRLSIFFTNDTLSNTSIQGLTIDGNGANNKISPNRPTYNVDFNQGMFEVSGTVGGIAAKINNVLIEYCTFQNNAGVCSIVCGQSNTAGTKIGSGWVIRNNIFKNNGTDTNDHTSVFGWMENAVIEENNFYTDSAFRYTGGVTAYEVHGSDQIIKKNKVTNYYRGMWVSSNLTDTIKNINITDNTFNTYYYGVDFFREASNLTYIKGVTISNNTFNFTDSSISSTHPDTKVGINISPLYAVGDINIFDNKGYKTGNVIPSTFFNINASSTANQLIDNVSFYQNKQKGFTSVVALHTNSTNGLGYISVQDNDFTNLTPAGGSSAIGLFSGGAGTIKTLVISGNKTIDTRTVKLSNYGSYLGAPITDYFKGTSYNQGNTVADDYENSLVVTNRHDEADSYIKNQSSTTQTGTLKINGAATVGNTINITGLRPILFDGNAGNFYLQGVSGGWNNGTFFKGSAGSILGGFGAFGHTDGLDYHWVGRSFDTATAEFYNGTKATILRGALTVIGNAIAATPTLSTHLTTKDYVDKKLDTSGVYVNSVVLNTSGVLYATPNNFTVTNHQAVGSLTLSTQTAYKLFGTGSSTATPSFLSTIDSNWIPNLHTQAYYDTRYQQPSLLYLSGVTSGEVIRDINGGANALALRLKNSTNDMYIGIESSVGGNYFTGSTAYATVITASSSKPIQHIINGVLRSQTTTSGFDVTGAITSTGTVSGATATASTHLIPRQQLTDSLSNYKQKSDSATNAASYLTRGKGQNLIDSISTKVGTSGTYTPTLTNTTNLTSSSTLFVAYTKVGSVVHVAISGNLLPTSTGAVELTLSLPFASTNSTGINVGFGNIGINAGVSYTSGEVILMTSTTVKLRFITTSATTSSYQITMDYNY